MHLVRELTQEEQLDSLVHGLNTDVKIVLTIHFVEYSPLLCWDLIREAGLTNRVIAVRITNAILTIKRDYSSYAPQIKALEDFFYTCQKLVKANPEICYTLKPGSRA